MLICGKKKNKEKDFKIAFGRYGFWIQMSVTLSENIIWDTHVVSTFSTALDGNGTPLQYSCLESPMDGGAWWAAVHGVTKGHTTE